MPKPLRTKKMEIGVHCLSDIILGGCFSNVGVEHPTDETEKERPQTRVLSSH